MRLVSIAVDSVDSLHYGCTTHFSSILLRSLPQRVKLADFPLLVRLNPAIPWKTRGNGAVVLRILYDGDVRELLELTYSLALEYSGGRNDVGIVIYEGEPWSVERLRWLYMKGLTSILTLDVVLSTLSKLGGLHAGGRGVIGATASLAALGPGDDFTFELLAYREPERWGSERCIDLTRGFESEASMPPCTFYNIDLLTGEFTASPGGSDPVLAGFRGDCIAPLFEYSKALCEEPHFWTLYRTNQHTDAHLVELRELAPYDTGYIEGTVVEKPLQIEGSHVIVRSSTKLGDLDLVFYRETGPLRNTARLLEPGDRVRVLGSLRPYKPRGLPVLAVEKMWVLEVRETTITINPRCPQCGHRMESLGSRGGFKCDHCGYESREVSKVTLRRPRALTPGVYVTGRLRHLTKPPWRRGFRGVRLPLSLNVGDVVFFNSNPKPGEELLRIESEILQSP